jgi:hypothetical protein
MVSMVRRIPEVVLSLTMGFNLDICDSKKAIVEHGFFERRFFSTLRRGMFCKLLIWHSACNTNCDYRQYRYAT